MFGEKKRQPRELLQYRNACDTLADTKHESEVMIYDYFCAEML